METDNILIQNNITSRKELQNLWQRTTGNCGSFDKIATIFVGYNGTIWNLDRPQEPEIFQWTSQAKWMTSKMVSEAARLQFYFMTYSEKDKHKGRHFVKKGLS